MKASELRDKLDELIKKHGDLTVRFGVENQDIDMFYDINFISHEIRKYDDRDEIVFREVELMAIKFRKKLMSKS